MSVLENRGLKVIWGSEVTIKPIRNAPDGRQRLRLRRKREARLFVKTSNSIREFALKDSGDFWEPALEIGSNHKLKSLCQTA